MEHVNKPKLQIVGDGAFGSFLKDSLGPYFTLEDGAESVLLAVPISAYLDCAERFKKHHLINVCSIQKLSTDILLQHSNRVTSIHPLFGKRTPENKRNSILTYSYVRNQVLNDTWFSNDIESENKFLEAFGKFSNIYHTDKGGVPFTPESHDILMSKTHLAALIGAKQLSIYVERAKDIPDRLIPNSFRLMREFVKSLEDMPQGTVESILANPY